VYCHNKELQVNCPEPEGLTDEVLKYLYSVRDKMSVVTLSGGEPSMFIREYWEKLFSPLISWGYYFCIHTTGYDLYGLSMIMPYTALLIVEHKAEKEKEWDARVQYRGAYSRYLALLELASAHKVPVEEHQLKM